MTQVPRRTKHSTKGTSSQVYNAKFLGQVVSVDQMISTHPGFIAQMTGKLTKQRYTENTVFVDHFVRLKYVFVIPNLFRVH